MAPTCFWRHLQAHPSIVGPFIRICQNAFFVPLSRVAHRAFNARHQVALVVTPRRRRRKTRAKAKRSEGQQPPAAHHVRHSHPVIIKPSSPSRRSAGHTRPAQSPARSQRLAAPAGQAQSSRLATARPRPPTLTAKGPDRRKEEEEGLARLVDCFNRRPPSAPLIR